MLGSDPGPRRSQRFVSDTRQAASHVSTCGLPPLILSELSHLITLALRKTPAMQALREKAGHLSASFSGYPEEFFVP